MRYLAGEVRALATLTVMACLAVTACQPDAGLPPALTGSVTGPDGRPVPGAFVTLRQAGTTIAVSAVADADGRYRLAALAPGTYAVTGHGTGARTARATELVMGDSKGVDLDLALDEERSVWDDARSPVFLGLLPEGVAKRRFILDCTGCHHFDQRTIGAGDRLKTAQELETWATVMIDSNPNMSPSRTAAETAAWLSEHLSPTPGSTERPTIREAEPVFTEAATRSVITEYDIPVPEDLPHDVKVDIDGRVVVTGQLSHAMFVLDPATGAFERVDIPVELANPRALDIDADGNWMVSLGFPESLARRDRGTGEWTVWHVGMHPHSVQLDADGDLWYNGHFSRDPERIGRWDAETGTVSSFVVPADPMPDGGITMQYGLRVAPDGTLWTTQLMGGRLVRFDPATEEFRLYDLPTSHSGPRRPDVDATGRVWIPEYSAGKLAMFDPRDERFTEYELPIADALPYVIRVDRVRDRVWIATAAAEAILMFDAATSRFEVFPMPTRGALIRHLDVDQSSGEVWGSYGAYPSRGVNKVFRLTPG
jgi:virginiamycin B lyase